MPAPSDAAVEQRLRELVQPLTYGLINYYHQLGCRSRVLNLPIMVCMVLGMIWRRVPTVAELLRTVTRDGMLWAPPVQVSEQAINQRLRCLPSELFAALFQQLLPILLARSRARNRPQPEAIRRGLSHFPHIWAVDATSLEEVSHKTGLLEGIKHAVLGGKLMALLDLPSKLPVHLWLDDDAKVNEHSFLARIKAVLPTGTLLIFDRGFHAFPFFDHLTEHGTFFLSRMRSKTAFKTKEVLAHTAQVRDKIIQLGQYRSDPCAHPVRLVEVLVGGTWQRYLTNVLDPNVLSAADVVDLYGRRWRIEEAFLLVKRLLGLSYLWNGAANAVALQMWATWLLYAVLIDLSDAIAQQLDLCLDQISVEMVYRGLYHFTVAHQKGLATDPVIYLASQNDLGIVKRRRKYRERARLDKYPQELNL